MYAKIVLTIAVLLPAVVCNLPRGAVCITPNDEISTCVAVTSCKVIIDAARTGNRTAIQFVQESQCGHDTVPLVCCGSVGYHSSAISRISPLLPDKSECGWSHKEFRVVGGEITGIDEYPWMALLGYKNNDGSDEGFKCGGSLINKNYVLTAAHCVITAYRMFVVDYVRLGEWDLTTPKDCEDQEVNVVCADPIVDIKVEQIIPHLHYGRSGKNDIALLRLASSVNKFTGKYDGRDVTVVADYIRPICLPQPNLPLPPENTRLTVSGWGATENDTTSTIKLKLEIPLVSVSICIEKYPRKNITEDQICAGGVRGRDSCRGDSGGPLMNKFTKQTANGRSKWYQEGIVSLGGVQCGVQGFPAVYTRVSKYVNWIVENIRE